MTCVRQFYFHVSCIDFLFCKRIFAKKVKYIFFNRISVILCVQISKMSQYDTIFLSIFGWRLSKKLNFSQVFFMSAVWAPLINSQILKFEQAQKYPTIWACLAVVQTTKNHFTHAIDIRIRQFTSNVAFNFRNCAFFECIFFCIACWLVLICCCFFFLCRSIVIFLCQWFFNKKKSTTTTKNAVW